MVRLPGTGSTSKTRSGNMVGHGLRAVLELGVEHGRWI